MAMSFSQTVKAELCRTEVGPRPQAVAESFGALLFCHTFTPREIKIVTGSGDFAERLPRLFRRAFGVDFETVTRGGRFTLAITAPERIERIAATFGYEPNFHAHHLNLGVLEEEGCRESFLRGAFLAGGSVTDPAKRYHLELATAHWFVRGEVKALLQDMGYEPGEVRRSGNYITYFKASDVIEELLAHLGAPMASLAIVNAKIEKSMTNTVNRKVNCDTANVLKTVLASEEQLRAIRRLREAGRFEVLPEKLRQAALLREENPELSLTDLAREAGLTKSGLSHRMHKLQELAERI